MPLLNFFILLIFLIFFLIFLFIHLGQPFDPIKIGVVHNLSNSQPVLWVDFQHLCKQVQKLVIKVLGELFGDTVSQADSFIQLPVGFYLLDQAYFHRTNFLIFFIDLQKSLAAHQSQNGLQVADFAVHSEGLLIGDEGKIHNCQSPDICGRGNKGSSENGLWGIVTHCSFLFVRLIPVRVESCQIPIYQLDFDCPQPFPHRTDQHITHLNIVVNYSLLMCLGHFPANFIKNNRDVVRALNLQIPQHY